jgi:hypothetical protein
MLPVTQVAPNQLLNELHFRQEMPHQLSTKHGVDHIPNFLPVLVELVEQAEHARATSPTAGTCSNQDRRKRGARTQCDSMQKQISHTRPFILAIEFVESVGPNAQMPQNIQVYVSRISVHILE